MYIFQIRDKLPKLKAVVHCKDEANKEHPDVYTVRHA